MGSAIAEFGRSVAAKMGRGGDPEHQLIGPMEILLRRFGAYIGLDTVAYGEVRLKDIRARPDYAVDVGRSRVGYIELKAPGRGVPHTRGWRPSRRERDQWQKLQALPNVIYTDGITWMRYTYGSPSGVAVKIQGSLTNLGEPLRLVDHGLLNLIREFLLWQPEQPHSLGDLIRVVAGLCNLLYDEVCAVLRDPVSSPLYEELTLLAIDWRSLLFPNLDDSRFGDAFAQTVTFALLLARADGIDFRDRDVHEIARRLVKKHLLIGKALSILTHGTAVEDLKTIETLRRVIGTVDWSKLNSQFADTYAQLYERFLTEYDPKQRKTTGSYYTPPELARSIVGLVDEVLRVRLGVSWGLAADQVVVLDPAMGTGTFLFEVIRAVAETAASRLGEGVRGRYVEDLVRKRLVGFEIQVAPYAVSELRLHQGLKSDFDVEIPSEELRFLTDALANPREQQQRLGATYRSIELARDKANTIKRGIPVMVVLGNPPHVENSKGRAPWVEARRKYGLAPRIRVDRPSLDEFRAAEPGFAKYESDLHGMPWYFWRWACWKVFEADFNEPAGVVAFITPSSFLTGRAFAGMREYLRRSCDEGWILDLSPEGNYPPGATRVFSAEVGRRLCIAIFARRAAMPDTEHAAKVWYMPLQGERSRKMERLATTSIEDDGWALCGSRPHDTFVPLSRQGWDEFPALADLMPWRSRGVTPGRTWVYAPSPDVLRERWKTLVTAPHVLRREMFGESRDRTLDLRMPALPGYTSSGRSLAEEDGESPEPIQFAYKAFDRQWMIPDNRLLVMPRPPLWAVRSKQQIFVSEQDDHAIDSGPGLVFTALIPDLHHFNNRSGGIRPLWQDDRARVPNVAPGVLDYISQRLGMEVAPLDLLAYIAALVSHRSYTARFIPELRSPGVRIPLSETASLWKRAIGLGRTVLWLHTFGSRCEDLEFRGVASKRELIESLGVRCRVDVARIPDRVTDRLTYDAESGDLLFGGGAFGPVPESVLDYDVGGRRVLWSWLNERTLSPRNKRRRGRLDALGLRSWSRQFTEELLKVLSVLKGCVQLEARQASLLQEVCDGPLITLEDLQMKGIAPPSPQLRDGPRQGSAPLFDRRVGT